MASLVDYALTNVADVKESLGISSGDTSKDNLIIRKINQVTDLIQNYCDRTFKLQQYTEYYDGSDTDEIVLKQRPIVADGSHAFLVERRDTSLNQESFETIDSSLFFIDNNSGVLELDYNALGGWNRYRYTYYAGYATTPNDLAEAAVAVVCFFVQNSNAVGVGKYSVREGQKQIVYQRLQQSFKTIIEELGVDGIIDSYANLPLLTNN